jgi:hypothetical protein
MKTFQYLLSFVFLTITFFVSQSCGPRFRVDSSSDFSSLNEITSLEVSGYQKVQVLDQNKQLAVLEELKKANIENIQILPESQILIKTNNATMANLKQKLQGLALVKPLYIHSRTIDEVDSEIERKLIDPRLMNLNTRKAPTDFKFNLKRDLGKPEKSSFFSLSNGVYGLKKTGSFKLNNTKIEEDGKSVINNSLSKYFPPISDQGRYGSCVAQSKGYYMSSYYFAKANDLDISSGDPKSTCNPLFLYWAGNYGKDEGMIPPMVNDIVSAHGCSSYEFYSTNRLFETPSYSAFNSGLERRLNLSYFNGSSIDYSVINVMRKYLQTGNIASAAIYVDNNFIKLAPASFDNGVYYKLTASEGFGAHAVTLVGYDDQRTYRNANGSVSYGAFLFANSWGSKWGVSGTLDLEKDSNSVKSAGYFWIGYDSLVNNDVKVMGISYYSNDLFNEPIKNKPSFVIKAVGSKETNLAAALAKSNGTDDFISLLNMSTLLSQDSKVDYALDVSGYDLDKQIFINYSQNEKVDESSFSPPSNIKFVSVDDNRTAKFEFMFKAANVDSSGLIIDCPATGIANGSITCEVVKSSLHTVDNGFWTLDGKKIEDSVNRASYKWDNTVPGTYKVQAIGKSKNGREVKSNIKTVKIISEINVSCPLSLIEGEDATCEASVSASVKLKSFYWLLNDQKIQSSDNLKSYKFSKVQAGSYSVEVVGVTDSGSELKSNRLDVTVKTAQAATIMLNCEPVVVLEGEDVRCAYLRPFMDVDETISTEWVVNGKVLPENRNSSVYLFRNVPAGEYSVKVLGRTVRGNQTQSKSIAVTAMKMPISDGLVKIKCDENLRAGANGSCSAVLDPSLSYVSGYWMVDGAKVKDSDGKATYTWTNVPKGNFKVQAVVADSKGLFHSSNLVDVKIDEAIPAPQNLVISCSNLVEYGGGCHVQCEVEQYKSFY